MWGPWGAEFLCGDPGARVWHWGLDLAAQAVLVGSGSDAGAFPAVWRRLVWIWQGGVPAVWSDGNLLSVAEQVIFCLWFIHIQCV